MPKWEVDEPRARACDGRAGVPSQRCIVLRQWQPGSLPTICLAGLLFGLLFPLVAAQGTWCFKIFQVVAAVFFILIVLRNTMPQAHALAAAPVEPTQPRSRSHLGLLVALATGFMAYVSILRLYFICDDFEALNLVRRPFMQSVWPQFTNGQSGGLNYIFYRPLGFASFFMDFHLWHYWAPGYHITSLLLHLFCIAGVYFLCEQLQFKQEASIAAALIFAVLPVNVQAIAWIMCRFDLLATGLGLWSLIFAVRFRRTGHFIWYAGAVSFFVLAVLCKESAYIIALLWFALELIPGPWPALKPPFSKRSEPLFGYVLVVLLMWVHRLHVLGGVGGYPSARDGSPQVESLGAQPLIGVLLRAPAETLFGYNWLRPAGPLLTYSALATAAIVLSLCLRVRTDIRIRRLIWFCLVWLLAAAVPAHFYFWSPDPGLFSSRVLHLGSAGLAILIAVLLAETFPDARSRLAATALLSMLLLIGVHHNLEGWQAASEESLRLQSVLSERQPSLPPRGVLFLQHLPVVLDGVPVFTTGLQSAVQFHYGWRDDIRVRTETSLHIEPRAFKIDMSP